MLEYKTEVIIMEELFNAFDFKGEFVEISNYGNGHINDTYRVITTTNQYIIQRINHHVFKNPNQLMHNYRLITDYLRSKLIMQGKDPMRETLTIVPTKDGKDYYQSQDKNYYRAIVFIKNCICLDTITGPEDFYQTGLAFGNFQTLLKDFEASQLYETIPNFHNTPKRFEDFLTVLKQADPKRIQEAKPEIDFILGHQKETNALYEANLPLRVTHNDTKLNNILFDKQTKKPLCIIDLDTIMPGFVANDFGDGIRSGATYSAEDEQDLEKVTLDLTLYEAFLDGFIQGGKSCLTKEEIISLPNGAKTITLEQAIRFLTDYLDGDHYYKTAYENHNLIRTRTQIKLVSEMERYQSQIDQMVQKYLG